MKSVVDVEKIKQYIKSNGLTQKQFCQVCGISQYALHKILTRQKLKIVMPLLKIAKTMQLNFADMYI